MICMVCFYEIMLYIVVDFGGRCSMAGGAQEKIVVDNHRICG